MHQAHKSNFLFVAVLTLFLLSPLIVEADLAYTSLKTIDRIHEHDNPKKNCSVT